MRILYDLMYRTNKVPCDVGARSELVDLVESGQIKACRAIDLGSGTASNAVFLAEHGFDVTGIDFSASAVERGMTMVTEKGMQASFFQDDLTNLSRDYGKFDLLVDYEHSMISACPVGLNISKISSH